MQKIGLATGLAALVVSATATAQDWTARPNPSNQSVGFSASAVSGGAEISGGCNRRLGAGFTFTLANYRGGALRTVPDASEPVVIEIDSGGATSLFPAAMHYVDYERAWVVTGLLPVAALDALARGHRMRLANDTGILVAEFDLAGTSALRAVMREVCGF
jgi:hypothetical protein